MDILNDVFPIVLYFLGAVLLVVIIMFVLKLMTTVDKVNALLDDVNGKSQKLNGLFDAIDDMGNTLNSFNSKISEVVTGVIKKLVKNKRSKKSKED